MNASTERPAPRSNRRRHVLVLGACALGILIATFPWWSRALVTDLVCSTEVSRSDVILVENLENSYLLFERAAWLQRQGYAPRVLVLVQSVGAGDHTPDRVPAAFAHVMGDIAKLRDVELVPFDEMEPVAMNAARQVGRSSALSGVRSLIVVADGFRSRRSHLVYANVLQPLAIRVQCVAVWGKQTPDNWTNTWHGMQNVLLQSVKLQYYRTWVIR